MSFSLQVLKQKEKIIIFTTKIYTWQICSPSMLVSCLSCTGIHLHLRTLGPNVARSNHGCHVDIIDDRKLESKFIYVDRTERNEHIKILKN